MTATLHDAYKFFTGAEFGEYFYSEMIIRANFKVGDSLEMMKVGQSKLFEGGETDENN